MMLEPPPPGGTRLILVRHAEPDEAVRGRCYGSLDVELSPRGRAQAASVARSLEDVEIAAIFSSPRTRALETAAALQREVVIVEDLREINFGALEGLTYADAEARYPDVYRVWMERPTAVRFPDGESYPQLRDRVRAAAAVIRRAHTSALIIAHGGTVRALVAEALNMNDRDIFRIAVDHASITVIDAFADGTPIVRLVNARA